MELFPGSPESKSRRASLFDTITKTHTAVRKDSVVPLGISDSIGDCSQSGKSGTGSPDVVSGKDRVRRLSRKLSLKPPSNIYRERRDSHTRKFSSSSSGSYGHAPPTQGHHTVTCECGRELHITCQQGQRFIQNNLESPPMITLSGLEVTDLKKAFAENQKATTVLNGVTHTQPRPRRLSVVDAIQTIQDKDAIYESVLKSCVAIGKIEHQDSLDVVLSRQNSIKSLIDAMKQYSNDAQLLLEACTSLLKQIKHSEASLHYLVINDGIDQLHNVLKAHPENTELLALALDIFGYLTTNDEWRTTLSEKVNHSDFLTTMSRHECDVIVVQKCCIVISNLVMSEDLARSLMYVGGVYTIISMMTKYNQNTEVLKHCCTALGSFASHDDTCQAVAEAGATNAVMSVMTSYPDNAVMQESCCWAMASLSRSGKEVNYIAHTVSGMMSRYNKDMSNLWLHIPRYLGTTPSSTTEWPRFRFELLFTRALTDLLKAMTSFPHELGIQEYGCWAICNLCELAGRVDDNVCKSSMEMIVECSTEFTNNVELLEHICYAIQILVSIKECVHETVVRKDGVIRLIEFMRTYEDNIDIQINGTKVLGNLAVNADFRRYVEDMGASESIIACMLKLDKNLSVQNTGCLALINLSAELSDNKFRILKNGGVHAVLNAMTNFMDAESLQLNALKVLCNLVESDKGCWWISEERGIQIISMTLKKYLNSQEMLMFGCTCLENLPRRGMNAVALEGVESTLLYLRMSMYTCTQLSRSLCVFYENVLKAGKECIKVFNKDAMERVINIMHEYDDMEIQITGCKILAQASVDENLTNSEVIRLLISTMSHLISDSNIQLICCGTISYLSSSEKGLKALESLDCIDVLLQSMSKHKDEAQIHSMCLFALENICKADFVRGKSIQNVCDAVATSMTTFPTNSEIQLGGCHILAVIGTGFHKQNEQRRKSMDCLSPLVSVVHRKSVTEEILEVASAAIQRIKKFKDDVLEESEDEDDKSNTSQTELRNINNDACTKNDPPSKDSGTPETGSPTSEMETTEEQNR